ncbi:porin [Candidatus Parabeggiatoa sp. HSG14]|uniref:OprO/OprP family phosphate-selective porin n=1 Tax=Candidatus Parabeggiatoa sp. HSG14 TaxID=3055593 RepID=UPI0025A7C16B|nr:porin [Thiotrichales bacterium HSG14]
MNLKTLSFSVRIATIMLLPWNVVSAGDTTLYKMLLENGAINQEQYEQLLKYNELQKNEGKMEEEVSKPKVDTQVKANVGSNNFQYKIGGRTMIDTAFYHDDVTPLNNSTKFRRVRLFIKGKMFKDWAWKTQYEFAGSGTLKDAYLKYMGLGDTTTLYLGQFGAAGSLEDSNSSKYITLMERALPVLAFSPATRYIGMGLSTYGNNWSFKTTLAGENGKTDELERDGLGLSGRMTYAPWHENDRVLHLGISRTFRIPRGNDTIRFGTKPEIDSNNMLIDTGRITAVNSYSIFGLETAWTRGPFSLQGEYIKTNVTRENISSLAFSGWYFYGSLFLTNESRPYDVMRGDFGRVNPKHPLHKGGVGAWEIALRLSSLSLEDQDIKGGKEDNLTLGINWYVNSNIRFMLNYVKAKVKDAVTSGEDENIDIVGIRTQVDF